MVRFDLELHKAPTTDTITGRRKVGSSLVSVQERIQTVLILPLRLNAYVGVLDVSIRE